MSEERAKQQDPMAVAQKCCEQILQEKPRAWGRTWDAQQERLNELEATLLHLVASYLPEEILAMIQPALDHRIVLDEGA